MYSSSNICSTMGIADTSIRTAGPEGSPLYDIHWLAKEDIENQTQTHNHTHTTNMAHSPPPSFGTYQTTVTPFKHTCILKEKKRKEKKNNAGSENHSPH